MSYLQLDFQAVVFTILILSVVCGQQQYFRVQPRNTTIQEGGEAVLECEVANVAGQVQWTKDGFALGFSSVIPGFPRYSVVGDRRHGIYNLRVSNASLEDDAEYQCQVGPSRQHKAIRANARLNVTSPPSSVEIMDYMSNSKIEIRENQELRLECVVRNAKPAARIVWYRGKVDLNIPNQETQIIEVPGKNGDRRITRYDTHSRISFKPTAEDDMLDYSCEARHDALSSPLRASVQLSVLYPPGVPYIEGYTEGEPIRRGQTVELVCKSRSGNPPAQLIWYKNGEQIRMAYRTAGRISENVYTFTADASDNKARYKCEASNVMSQAALKAEVDMSVLFSPAQVTISGPSEARVGDRVTLTCTTGSSNPPAEIKWMLAGKQVSNASSKTIISPEGGWVTTSNITTTIEADRRNLVAICHGLNRQLAENVVSTHTINVLYPPGQPYIIGYNEGAHVPAGTVQKLLCTSAGGNPLATLTWFKNDKKINSAVKTTDHSISAELTVLTNATDNGAQYRCEATNAAIEIPLFETITMSVYFPPEHVKIRKQPSDIFKPNEQATILCDSSSSNPTSSISFWRDGIPVTESVNTTKSGLHGGTVSSIELTLNITEQMDSVIYTCQATNEALERSVHDSVKLRVLYKPAFTKTEDSVIGVENEPLTVVLEANGNPSEISYNWSKDGLPIQGSERIITNSSVLYIANLNRNDAGVYKCDAANSQGKSTAYVNITVKYSATIVATSQNTIVSPNEDATLTCTVDGNPIAEDSIKWEREDFPDFDKRTSVSYDRNGTSYLKVTKATRVDLGSFWCIADNGVGNSSRKEVMLIVKHKPEIDDSPSLLKFASDAGHTGKLICQSQAFPIARYSWSRTGSPITTNTTGKYYTTFRQIDTMKTESVLYITHVTSSDYGKYECVARNELGFSTISPSLEISSPPDTPTQLRVLNVTHNTVTLSWIPGFDGGMEVAYRIRYRPVLGDGYSYVDVVPHNTTQFIVRGLDADTQYVFSVMAMNKLGNSKFMPDILSAKTSDKVLVGHSGTSIEDTNLKYFPGFIIMICTILGSLLILSNVLLIGCCLHRRSKKRLTAINDTIEKMVSEDLLGKQDIPGIFIISGSVVASILLIVNVGVCIACQRKKARKNREQNNQSSKTATIEMYAPSSYNDTITGETLSSVSEKSETYSNEGSQPDYTDENRKQLPNAYIMDEADYPGPYHPTCLDYELRIQPTNQTHTLPHAHHQHHHMHDPNRAKEDPNIAYHRNTLGKTSYISAPSPAPPSDGSYFNMSDRYLTYPSPLEFQKPPTIPPHPHVVNYQPGAHSMMTISRNQGHQLASGVPPPDVLYNTNQTAPILKAQKVELTTANDNTYEVNQHSGHLV